MPSGSNKPATTSSARWCQASIALAVSSLLCLAAGAALPFIAGSLFSSKLAQMLPISPDSVAYSSWLSTELRFQVWMWNVTNVREVLSDRAAVPRLSQVGPFTFRELRTREGVKFQANGTVEFRDVRTYYFLAEESVGRMADYAITNVNLPYVSVALRMRDSMLNLKKIVKGYLDKYSGGLFITRTVEDLLLGYDDAGMLQMKSLVRALTGLDLPTRFGILLGKNATAKGTALVGTGAAGRLHDLNRIHLWNGRPHLQGNPWRQAWANQVVGTDGAMFPPPVTPERALLVFTPDLCRSANMTFRRYSSVRGIPVLTFSPAESTMHSAARNPDNAAFCAPRCLASGVLSLSRCLPGGPPVVASAPLFHGAPAYAAAVDFGPAASHEDGREFETQIEVEPNTGLMLRAARRMQINIGLEPVAGFQETQRFQPLHLMPYLWLNESGSIGPQPAARFKRLVLQPLQLASLISWLLVALGLALAVLALVVFCLGRRLRPVPSAAFSSVSSGASSGHRRRGSSSAKASAEAKEAAAVAAMAAAAAAEALFVRPPIKSDSRRPDQQEQQQQNDSKLDLIPFLPETSIV